MTAIIKHTPRTFEISDAKLDRVPLWVGITAPSGAGKTFSALRLAAGMQQVSGGDIGVIDTEQKRALHYADRFKFKHIPFTAPFGSLAYLDAAEFAVKKHGVKTCIIDSMSHEHEGVGGYLLTHEAEMLRLGGTSADAQQRATYTAWILPSGDRRRLINGLIALECNFIFCFRAKDKLDFKSGKPTKLGWMPIAGPDFLFELTVSSILYPGAKGVPTWDTDMKGEGKMLKLPGQFENLFEEPRQFDEETGRALATWANGGGAPKSTMTAEMEKLIDSGKAAASKGIASLQEWFKKLPKADQKRIKPMSDATLKPLAYDADEKAAGEPKDAFGLDAKTSSTAGSPPVGAGELVDELEGAMQQLKGPPSTELQELLDKIASADKAGVLDGMLKYADDIGATLAGPAENTVFLIAAKKRRAQLDTDAK